MQNAPVVRSRRTAQRLHVTPATTLHSSFGSIFALSFSLSFISPSWSSYPTLTLSDSMISILALPISSFSVSLDHGSIDPCAPPLRYRASGITHTGLKIDRPYFGFFRPGQD